jgi:hypothetical protein
MSGDLTESVCVREVKDRRAYLLGDLSEQQMKFERPHAIFDSSQLPNIKGMSVNTAHANSPSGWLGSNRPSSLDHQLKTLDDNYCERSEAKDDKRHLRLLRQSVF